MVLNQVAGLSLTYVTSPSSKDRMFQEWDASLPPTHDCRRLLPTYALHSSPRFSPFTQGVLSLANCQLQSVAFQIYTGHAFNADYSDRFRPLVNDNTICPHCEDKYPECFTIAHALNECNTFWTNNIYRDTVRLTTPGYLLSCEVGGRKLTRFC